MCPERFSQSSVEVACAPDLSLASVSVFDFCPGAVQPSCDRCEGELSDLSLPLELSRAQVIRVSVEPRTAVPKPAIERRVFRLALGVGLHAMQRSTLQSANGGYGKR